MPWFESVLPHKYFLFHLSGLPLLQLRAGLVAVMALATSKGTAVSQTGLTGVVGLATPHMVRARSSKPRMAG